MMENEKLCMSCMKPLAENDTVCPHCHYSVDRKNPAGYLPAGTLLGEHYLVGRALGSYGDACIYVGYDKLLKSPIFLREFFPADFSERAKTGAVLPIAGREDAFAACYDSFLANARALARLKDLPCLLPLYDIFTDNDTAYAIYDFCEGRSLSRELKARGGRMSWNEARPLFMQLMTTLSALHRAGVYHLAISPDTILVGADGKFRLRSFAISQARTTGSPIKPRLTAGFAAPEQYALKQDCGEPADVYGLAATIFCAITGNVPPEATTRLNGSQDLFLPAEVAEELPEEVSMALFNALQPDVGKRIGTVEEFRSALTAEPSVSALLDEETEEKPPKKNRYPLYIGITVFVILAVLAAILLAILFPQNKPASDPLSDIPAPTTSPKTSVSYKDPTSTYSIPNLVGKNYFSEKKETRLGDFKLEIEYMKFDTKKAKGTILSQEPAAGTGADAGATIKVVISMGTEDLVVPDVAGWPQEYATKYLEALGFRVDTLLLNQSDYEKGIVDSTDPEPKTELGVGDTVTLRVSNMEPTAATTDGTDDANH